MKLWGGRFSGRRDPQFEKFSESFSLDQRFVLYDLRVNLAYVKALGQARALETARGRAPVRRFGGVAPQSRAQSKLGARADRGGRPYLGGSGARAQVGDVARKLRTGRSRNDLVATEMRLYVKDATLQLERALVEMLAAVVMQARRNIQLILPGYTHLQPAQPILFSHYLLAYFEMFHRDVIRLTRVPRARRRTPHGRGSPGGNHLRGQS